MHGVFRGHTALWLFLALVLACFVSLELFCRFGVSRISRIERRTAEEYQAALDGKRPGTSTQQVLVVGNSLLGVGVHFDRLHGALLPAIDAKRLLVEDTAYYDWYYGMRKLFNKGARPDVVVLVLSPAQLVSSRIRGEYSAYHLIQPTDTLRVARDLGLSNTETSSLAFASASAFFGLRSELRKFIAGKVFPNLPALMGKITRHQPVPLEDKMVFATAMARLTALRELTAQRSSRVVVVIPPATTETGATAVHKAGQAVGVSVLVPMPTGSLGQDCFSDGFHLNEMGAEVFTSRLIHALRTEINDS